MLHGCLITTRSINTFLGRFSDGRDLHIIFRAHVIKDTDAVMISSMPFIGEWLTFSPDLSNDNIPVDAVGRFPRNRVRYAARTYTYGESRVYRVRGGNPSTKKHNLSFRLKKVSSCEVFFTIFFLWRPA